jgi:membrane dipeptidase
MFSNTKNPFAYLFIVMLLAACSGDTEQATPASESPETEEALIARALEIHDRVLTFDSHADTPLRMIDPDFDMSVRHDPRETGSKVDYPRMTEGGLDAIFFAAFVAQDIRDDDGNSRAKALALQMLDATIQSVEDNSEKVGLALNPQDAYDLQEQGKHAVYLAIENGYPIGDDLSNLQLFFDKGVRYITLVHSTNNDLADSATDDKGPEHGGLSEPGKEVVKEMNRLGIMVDVSHASDDVFFDTIALSEAPIIATHSNARSVTDHKRNMSDEMLKVIAENGGVVQLTMLSSYLRELEPNPERSAAFAELRASLKPASEMTPEDRLAMRSAFNELNAKYPPELAYVQDAVDHIDHIVEVAGIDHIGIGCDFDGGGGINGVFDASEVMNITIELVKRGYTEEQVEKIWSGNLMRVFREVQEVAERMQSEA